MDKTVSAQMHTILEQYEGDVKDAWNNGANMTAKESVQKLRNTSPKRSKGGGAYARSWTVKAERHGELTDYIVHNSKHYQLTHLLENGHVIRNKKGTYGRTNPIKHIAPVEDWAVNELPNEIERNL